MNFRGNPSTKSLGKESRQSRHHLRCRHHSHLCHVCRLLCQFLGEAVFHLLVCNVLGVKLFSFSRYCLPRWEIAVALVVVFQIIVYSDFLRFFHIAPFQEIHQFYRVVFPSFTCCLCIPKHQIQRIEASHHVARLKGFLIVLAPN